jgi:hypothetical protein
LQVYAWYALAVVGLGLVVVGAVAVFKVKTSGTNIFEAFGIKVQAASTGGFLAALGVALLVLGVYNGVQTKTLVTAVRLSTDTGQGSAEYNVRCPIEVALIGSISITGDPGTVSYELDQQSGLDGPISKGTVETLAFAHAGTENVIFNIPVNVPEGQVSFTATLTVINPTSSQSDPVQVSVTCNPGLPPNPPSGPPTVPGGPPG